MIFDDNFFLSKRSEILIVRHHIIELCDKIYTVYTKLFNFWPHFADSLSVVTNLKSILKIILLHIVYVYVVKIKDKTSLRLDDFETSASFIIIIIIIIIN